VYFELGAAAVHHREEGDISRKILVPSTKRKRSSAAMKSDEEIF
jgi:hypothetical protein